ncbi:hypothetical protein Tco_1551832, partial [Tanacetum coccineum]
NNTTKVDSKPPNGLNGDITNPYEGDQTHNVSADTTNSSAVQASDLNVNKTDPVHFIPGPAPILLTPGPISLGLVPNPSPAAPYVPPTNKELEILFQPSDQTLNVSADTTNSSAVQASDLNVNKTAPVHFIPGPVPILLTPGPISSGLVPNPPPAAPYVPPTNKELEILFQPIFDEYFKSSTVDRRVPPTPAAQAPDNPTGPSVSIPIDQEAPSGSHSPSSSDHQSSSVHHGVAAEQSFEVNPFSAADLEPFVNVFALDSNSKASSSRVITTTEPNQSTQPHEHL